MRYDDYDDYSSRSSRGSSRRNASSYSGGRNYDREYERDFHRDRDYRGDFGREYDRGYYDRDRYSDRYADRYTDRYSTRSSRDWNDDFDRSDWERTAPNWEDHSGSRKKRPSSGGSSRSSRGGSSRNSSGRSQSSSRSSSGRRPSEGQRRSSSSRNQRSSASSNRRGAVQILPIAVGLVVIILAALVIRSMLGGKGNYEIKFSTPSIVVGETAEATLMGVKSSGAEPAVEWTSKDNNVVSVSGNGLTCTLTAESLGRATIVATIDGETAATNTVEVVETARGVMDIRVSQDSVTIRSGETYTISATVVMDKDDMAPATIKWSSNDTTVAKVDNAGVVTGQDVGKAIIKGVAGEKTVEIAVEVVENPNSTPHDPTKDAGQAPEEGTIPPKTNGNSNGTTGGTGGTGNAGNTGGAGGTGNTGNTGGTGGTGGTGNTGGAGGTGGTENTGGTGGTGGGDSEGTAADGAGGANTGSAGTGE